MSCISFYYLEIRSCLTASQPSLPRASGVGTAWGWHPGDGSWEAPKGAQLPPSSCCALGSSRCLKGAFLAMGCCLVWPFCTHSFLESPLIIFRIAMLQSTGQTERDNYACSEKQSQWTWFMSGNIIDFCFFTEIMGTLHREFTARNILPYWHMKGARLLLQQYFIDFVIRHSVRWAMGLIWPYLEQEVFPQPYTHDSASQNHSQAWLCMTFRPGLCLPDFVNRTSISKTKNIH